MIKVKLFGWSLFLYLARQARNVPPYTPEPWGTSRTYPLQPPSGGSQTEARCTCRHNMQTYPEHNYDCPLAQTGAEKERPKIKPRPYG